MRKRVDISIALVDKAIMQLTGLGANNTAYLLEVKAAVKDLWEESQQLEAKQEGYDGALVVNTYYVEDLEHKERIYREALEVALSYIDEPTADNRKHSRGAQVIIAKIRQALNTEVK